MHCSSSLHWSKIGTDTVFASFSAIPWLDDVQTIVEMLKLKNAQKILSLALHDWTHDTNAARVPNLEHFTTNTPHPSRTRLKKQ